MAIIGVFTDIGVIKAREAQNDEGFKIFPTNFGVSRTAGVVESSRTSANAGLWFTGPISSRVVVDNNTIKFVCTIPAGSIPPNTTDTVREIYLYGTDTIPEDFLFAIGQPTTPLLYDPSGSLTLELELALSNVDLTSAIVFSYTQATEINEHNSDPCAHLDYLTEMGRAGMFVDAGCVPQRYAGQIYDKHVSFEGVKASGTYFGITFEATWVGPDGNSITLPFDGVKSTDEVRAIWNAANPDNTVEHNGLGTEILPVGVLNLASGSIAVEDRTFVYMDVDGIYKEAIADGTIKSKVAGIAYVSERLVKTGTYHEMETGVIAPGTDIFLENTGGQEGKITTFPTTVKLGFVLAPGLIVFGSQGGSGGGGGGGGGTAVGFDAIVSDQAGVDFYPTTQEAIDAVGDGARILVDKLEFLDTMIDATGKRIDFHFNGPEAGWSRFQGLAEVQKITFSAVPTAGTWRIEFGAQETIDLPFNATNIDVQNAINALTIPGLPVAVAGDYTIGFTLTFTTLVDVPQPTFLHPGTNEVQRISFDNVPDDGTVQFDLDGNVTANLAWNDDALLFESYLESLANVSDVTVTGSFAAQQFDVEFTGVDGKQPWNEMTVVMSDLEDTPTATVVTVSTPIEGIYPASNLKNGVTPIVITSSTLIGGSPIGPIAAIQVGANYTRFTGLGKIENFDNGIDLNGFSGVDVEMLFTGTVNPLINTGLTGVKDYHTEKSFGMASRRDIVAGPFGDYPTLWDAVAAANAGDRILVTEDQNLFTAQTIDKDVEIHFMNGKSINVTGFVAGDVLSLGSRVRTRYLKLSVADAGLLPVVIADQGNHVGIEPNFTGVGPVPIAQGFDNPNSIDIYEFDLWLEKFGLPVADVYVDIYADNAGDPTGALIGSTDPIAAASLPAVAGGGLVTFSFAAPLNIGVGTYWAVLRVDNVTTFDLSNRINVYYDDAAYASEVAKRDPANDGNWETFGVDADLFFQVRGVNTNNFDTLIRLFGTRGNHEDLTIATSGVSTVVDKAFEVDTGATGIFVDGVISHGSATINNVLVNTSGFKSHNVIIRDPDSGMVFDIQDRYSPEQEVPIGAVNGVNDTFALSFTAQSKDATIVMVDGIPRPKSEWELITGNTEVQFGASHIPQPGQSVYVYYFPGGVANTPPRHLTIFDNSGEVLKQVKEIDFGAGLDVVQTAPNRVQVSATGGGGGGGEPEVEQRIITAGEALAKQLILAGTPATPAKTMVFVQGAGNAFYGDDFAVVGSTLDWTGLGFDTLPVTAGDKWTIMYWT